MKPAAVGSSQALDAFGASIAVSGDTVVVGANLEDRSTLGVNGTPNELAADAGTAYVFLLPPNGLSAVSFSPAGDKAPANGAAGRTIAVTTNPAGGAWVAASNSPWIKITGGASGTGNGTVSYDVAASPDAASRVLGIAIGGSVFVVVQDGSGGAYPAVEVSGPIAGSGAFKTFVLVT